MSIMTHAQTIPLGAFESANAKENAALALGSSHLAMIKRFARFALMVSGFFLLMVAVMSVKYAAFFLHVHH